MLYGLDDETVQKLLQIMSRHSWIDQVYLYGSRAKGNYRPGSDIDFTVKGEAVTSEALYELIDEIEELYLPWKIDISIFDHIDNVKLIEHINRVGIEFYKKESN